MIEEQINRKYLNLFLRKLKKEDFEEVKIFNKKDLIDEILNVSKNPSNKTYFLTNLKKEPLAVGGACMVENSEYKVAKVWLLTTNYIGSNKKSLMKYVLNKISFLKKEYDVLFNFIYKCNFPSLKWIKKAGFNVLDFSDDYKLFYFTKGDISFDLRYFTS